MRRSPDQLSAGHWGLRRLWLIGLFTFLCSTKAPADTITLADCIDFINERTPLVSCGFVEVPLNHDNSDSGRISLPVVIARATGSRSGTTDRAVFVPGGGGPGASLGFGLPYDEGEYLQAYRGLRQAGFDIVLLDQRGAGLSQPKLTCPETVNTFKSLVTRHRSTSEEIALFHQAITQCQRRLEESSISLRHFDTRQSALDFLQVMDKLPYRWWGALATSYATAIAQAMMLQKPEAFDKVVLDSPVPLDFQQPMTSERSTAAITKTLALCAREKHCNSRYPDLGVKLNAIIQRAAERPFGIKIKVYTGTGDLRRETLIVDDHTLLSILSTAVYTNAAIATLPKTINRFYQGNKQAIQEYAEEYWYQSTDSAYADGLYLSVHCKERQMLEERYMQNYPDEINTLSTDSILALNAQAEYCSSWGVHSDNRILPQAKFREPALVLAGALDPVISKKDIDNTVNDFLNIVTTIVPGAGHSVWFQSECARRYTLAFFTGVYAAPTVDTCDTELPDFE